MSRRRVIPALASLSPPLIVRGFEARIPLRVYPLSREPPKTSRFRKQTDKPLRISERPAAEPLRARGSVAVGVARGRDLWVVVLPRNAWKIVATRQKTVGSRFDDARKSKGFFQRMLGVFRQMADGEIAGSNSFLKLKWRGVEKKQRIKNYLMGWISKCQPT